MIVCQGSFPFNKSINPVEWYSSIDYSNSRFIMKLKGVCYHFVVVINHFFSKWFSNENRITGYRKIILLFLSRENNKNRYGVWASKVTLWNLGFADIYRPMENGLGTFFRTLYTIMQLLLIYFLLLYLFPVFDMMNDPPYFGWCNWTTSTDRTVPK